MSRVRYLFACVFWGLGASLLGAAAPAADATPAFVAHLSAGKDTKTLMAEFLCEKRIVGLDTPLLSQGAVRIARGSVRYSTAQPYGSELILHQGKLYARTQHETAWYRSSQPDRPGLTAVMGHLAACAIGDGAKVTTFYTVKPASGPLPEVPAGVASLASCDVFVLEPKDVHLAKSLRQLRLVIDRAHRVRLAEITTPPGDVTRYWLSHWQVNVSLPRDIFEPTK